MNTQINSLSRQCIIRQADQKPNFSHLKIKVVFNFKILFLQSLATAFFQHTFTKELRLSGTWALEVEHSYLEN